MFSYGNDGKIVGIVRDAETNEPLPGAAISIKNSTDGTSTDFDGMYTLNLEKNTYTVIFNYIGYRKIEVTNVIIKSGEITNLDISLTPELDELDEVVINASTVRNSEASVLNYQKRSVQLMDGISAQTLRKVGASNLANAVKNIPGVTVENGKYVYVRGLGDRYTKTILNNMEIPGLDPDKNSLQMDIFSTSILDNVMVIKSFTAEMPADFTGGLINVITKDFPSKETYSISVGASYNPNMHFNSNYLAYQGGNTDFLAFDNGTRDRPLSEDTAIPYTFDNNEELTNLTQKFDTKLAANQTRNMMDYNIGISAGNQYQIGINKLGYIASINYKSGTKFYENAIDNNIGSIASDGEIRGKKQIGSLGKSNILISGLAGLTYKTQQAKYKFNILHIQNSNSKSGVFTQVNNDSDFVTFKKDHLDYTQRGLTNIALSGVITNKEATFKTNWFASSTLSSIYDKDVRTTAFQVEDTNYSINPNTEPRRIWRDLNEQNHNIKIDFTKDVKLFSKESKLKFGLLGLYKNRDYGTYVYQIGLNGNTSIYNGDANTILAQENLWTVDNEQGSYIRNTTIQDPANQFKANQLNFAAYISESFQFNKKFKGVLGVRVEKYVLNYTGKNTSGLALNNKTIIDKLDVFPSINMIYKLKDDNKIRFSYSITTARPFFKEASIAEIYDPLSNTTFIGNIDLKPSYINNLDLRYELYGENSQLFAISAFYKTFKDPIELTYYKVATDNFTPRNLGFAKVFGVELEIRKNFGFISKKLKHLKFSFNTSIIQSELRIGDDEMTLRKNTAQEGETINDTRQLQGQAPYLINAGLDYESKNIGLEVGLHYNVQGETLQVVGGIAPDVYSQAFHDLKLILNKSIGNSKKSTINLKIGNILNQKTSSLYHLYGSNDVVFSERKIGTTISVGYKFKF